MKILMVSGTFPPRKFGGITAVSHFLAKNLAKRGHEVTVYTTDVGNAYRSRLDVHGIKIMDGVTVLYFRNISNSLAFKHRLFLPLGMVSAIRKDITNFDLIHLHDFRSLLSVIIHHYAKKYNIPYTLQAHGSVLPIVKASKNRTPYILIDPCKGLFPFVCVNLRFNQVICPIINVLDYIFQKQRLRKTFDLFFGYKILNDASKVIAVTKTEAEQYKKMGVNEGKIEIVPNGIDPSEYDNLPKRGKFRRKYSISDNEKLILYLGRIHESKGIDLLVKAYSDILRDFNDVRLVICGLDDGFLSTLKKQIEDLKISDRILFTGPLSERDKLKAYVDADVFVNPRADEIFGLVFIEACACGTPVICSKGCGLASVINNQVGFAVSFDKDQLEDAILKVLGDEGLRKRFGAEGRRLVREEFVWENIAEETEKVYLNLIK